MKIAANFVESRADCCLLLLFFVERGDVIVSQNEKSRTWNSVEDVWSGSIGEPNTFPTISCSSSTKWALWCGSAAGCAFPSGRTLPVLCAAQLIPCHIVHVSGQSWKLFKSSNWRVRRCLTDCTSGKSDPKQILRSWPFRELCGLTDVTRRPGVSAAKRSSRNGCPRARIAAAG